MSYMQDQLDMLSGIASCIAQEFGSGCEVVIHDLTLPYERTIVHIENGHVTGRKVGDSGTNAGLEVLREAQKHKDADRFNYINYSKNGRILRSSSKYFRDSEGTIIGSLCINYDITELVMAQRAVHSAAFLNGGDDAREDLTGNVDELLQNLFRHAVALTGKSIAEMTKEDKVKAVRYLDEKGAFLIKKSVDTVSDYLGVSKFTLYNYLDEGRENAPSK